MVSQQWRTLPFAPFSRGPATAKADGRHHAQPHTQKHVGGSAQADDIPGKDDKTLQAKAQDLEVKSKPQRKTVAEADAELMRKLSDASGEGGAAGVEYEDGKPVAQKRSVRNNMFRLI